jgi:hypothetical protein
MSIQYINIVHHSHTDFGYTDHPLKARKLLAGYIDQALDHVLESQSMVQPFAWTCETLLPVWDWWQQADPARQDFFLQAADTGLIDVMGLPFNTTAFLSAGEWEHMMNWIPRDLWDRLHISCAMQNDINGLPAGGMMKMMNAGIHSLWVGPNSWNGRPPLPAPSVFWWKMPDGRRLFVWLNPAYCNGYYLFNPNWREGPVPDSSDLHYRAPREGDFFRTDEASVRAAHALCAQKIAMLEGSASSSEEANREGFTRNIVSGAYPYKNLCVSLTNQWRMDNDPPFYPVRAFVETWNALGLEPKLRLVTATRALEFIREEAGDSAAQFTGEWPDWWANGTPSMPVELSASRKAKRLLESARSPVFGAGTGSEDRELEHAGWYNLCMFDEHTYGSWASIAYPYSVKVRSARIEKELFAYRSLDNAEELLAAKAARLCDTRKEGIFVINPDTRPYSGWIELPVNCLRGDYTSIKNSATGEEIPLMFAEGRKELVRPESPDMLSDENVSQTFADKLPRQIVKARLEKLPPCSVTRFLLLAGDCPAAASAAAPAPEIRLGDSGWPIYLRFAGEASPLFYGSLGDFFSVTAEGLAPRWVFKDIFNQEDPQLRQRMAAEQLREIDGVYETARRLEDDYEILFIQNFSHPSLAWGKRILRINKTEKTASATIRINRRSNMNPEIYYGVFSPAGNTAAPLISNAGLAFSPGAGQLPGSCMDYYVIDEWIHYQKGADGWLLVSRDAPVVSFGKHHVSQRINRLPEETGIALFMLFNNTWDTNFAADSQGIMEFSFDLAHCPAAAEAETLGRSMTRTPLVLVNTGVRR